MVLLSLLLTVTTMEYCVNVCGCLASITQTVLITNTQTIICQPSSCEQKNSWQTSFVNMTQIFKTYLFYICRPWWLFKYFICIMTRRWIYGKIKPDPNGVPEGGVQGNSQGLRLYFNVHLDSSHNKYLVE